MMQDVMQQLLEFTKTISVYEWAGGAGAILLLIVVLVLLKSRKKVKDIPETQPEAFTRTGEPTLAVQLPPQDDEDDYEDTIDDVRDEFTETIDSLPEFDQEETALAIEPSPEEVDEFTSTIDSLPEFESEPEPEPVVTEPVSLFARLKAGLTKTRTSLSNGLGRVISGKKKLDEEVLEELEELLITSDIGVKTSMSLIENIGKTVSDLGNPDVLKSAIQTEIISILGDRAPKKKDILVKPYIMMIVGVNGVGKTTTIGKLAAKYRAEGKKVLLVAADTFRAAAAEQLTVWADRSGADIVKHRDNSDPAAVAYDGIEASLARDIDVVLIDTAGRLHTKVNLMEEIKKIKRTISKKIPNAPHDTMLVLDATTGQNALSQAKLFNDALEISNLALTKLDGTAKGGIVISICDELKIPLKYIGVGEQIDDLQLFDPVKFAEALF